MNKKIIYHGSTGIIEHPEFGKGKPYNDYGLGFYCTESLNLAKEWACSTNEDGFANEYEIDLDGLKILDLSSEKYTILNWLAILLQNRIVAKNTPMAARSKKYILENFLIPYEEYDIIIGYRADDSYFSFTRYFLNNEISLKQLKNAMKLGKSGEQIVIKSEIAFSRLTFLEYIEAKNLIYGQKKKERDIEARNSFESIVAADDLKGIFIRDIMTKGMKNDDTSLR